MRHIAIADDTDWVGCSVTPAGSNFDTSWFAAAIELDGTVQESFSFGDGRELFNTGLKYLNKLIENTWRTKNFRVQYFRDTQGITEIHKNIVSRIFGASKFN